MLQGGGEPDSDPRVSGMAKSSRVAAVVHAVLGFQLGAEVRKPCRSSAGWCGLHQDRCNLVSVGFLLRDQLKASQWILPDAV